MPLYVVRSAPVRSPDPAAPIQCTSGQPGAAEAVVAERPANTALAAAAAQASVVTRRNMEPQPFSSPYQDLREVHRPFQRNRYTCHNEALGRRRYGRRPSAVRGIA